MESGAAPFHFRFALFRRAGYADFSYFANMIGTIRKHSAWLWWVIAILTVISFVYWGVAPSATGGGPATGQFGSLYGHKITRQDYDNAKNEFYLFYWFRNFEWPKNLSEKDLDQQVYLRLMLKQKAESLGIHVSDDEAGEAAATMLRSLGRNGEAVPMDAFVNQVLKPAGLTTADFERFVRDDVAIQQLIQTIGLTGELITPQEVQDIYERENQELQAQAVFFSASNYLAEVNVQPAAVAQFYTNYMAEYRLPDRIQISYVVFKLTNYFAAAEKEIGKTNLDEQVEAEFRAGGMDSVPGAKTPDEAKSKIRDELLRRHAITDATKAANDFATIVYAKTPVSAANLAAVAKEKNLTVRTTAPFDAQYGPTEFPASSSFIKDAFDLTTDNPFATLGESDGVYVIALDKKLPSEIPSLNTIRTRVAYDYQTMLASRIAESVGTNFVAQMKKQMDAGKSFAAACAASGRNPETLPPFSLKTADLPELGARANLSEIKQIAFSTPVGHASDFVPTQDGGFVIFVEKKLPLNQADMKAALPQFTAQLRGQRANEAFNSWIQIEANREFRNIPAFQKEAQAAQNQVAP